MSVKGIKTLIVIGIMGILPLSQCMTVFGNEYIEASVNVLAEDAVAPELHKVEIDKILYSPGDTIKIRVYASDDLSGLNSISINLLNPKGELISVGNSEIFNEEGMCEINYNLSQYAMSGTWSLDYIFLSDNAGNYISYSNKIDFEGDFVVAINTKEDTVAPELRKVEFDKEVYKPGDTVKIKMYASDDLSGLAYTSVNIYDAKGDFVGSNHTRIFNEEGMCELNYELSNYAMGGTWEVRDIFLIDIADNYTMYTTPKDFEGDFVVDANNQEDTTSPRIHKVEFDKDSYKPGDIVKIKIYASDDLSGLDRVSIDIYDSKGQLIGFEDSVVFDEQGMSEICYELTEYAISGIWNVGSIFLYDKASNGVMYTNKKDYEADFIVSSNESPLIHAEDKVVKVGEKVNLRDGVSATDKEDGDITNKVTIEGSLDINSVGLYPITYSVQDSTGNTTNLTISVKVVYGEIKVSKPLNSDDLNVMKLGRTIPIKFQLKDANNNFINNATAYLSCKKISNETNNIKLNDALFRYDNSSNQYMYNLSTKGFEKGDYILSINLGDDKSHTIDIRLR